MTSRSIATLSAVLLGACGLVLLFAPDVVVSTFVPSPVPLVEVVTQLLGGAWLGVAMLNWFTRSQPIGGIYGRPVVFANLLLYFVAASALLKVTPWRAEVPFIAGVVTAVMAAVWMVAVPRPAMRSGFGVRYSVFGIRGSDAGSCSSVIPRRSRISTAFTGPWSSRRLNRR